jgi:hypothetical protein
MIDSMKSKNAQKNVRGHNFLRISRKKQEIKGSYEKGKEEEKNKSH